MEMREGWVSVVVPTYNRAGRLAASIGSCFDQEYPQLEVIVVDDGSTDETPEVLRAFELRWGPERFRWIRQDNLGACVARNAGMDLARGEFLQFHDSDDILLPRKISEQVAALQRTGADVAVCDMMRVQDDPEHTPIGGIRYAHDLLEAVARYQHVSIPCLLMRRRSVPAPLRWNPAIERQQDMDFVVRYLLTVDRYVHTPGYWVLYVHHEDEQISDGYRRDHYDNRGFFDSLMAYLPRIGDRLSPERQRLARRAVMHLALRAALAGEGHDARAMLRFASRGPGRLARLPRAAAAAALSLAPSRALAVARRARGLLRSVRQGA